MNRRASDIPGSTDVLTPAESSRRPRSPSAVRHVSYRVAARPRLCRTFRFTDADICLRSVDGCHFRAHKAILVVTSAALRDLGFESPAGGRDIRNGLPVILFVAAGEEESVVANFLRLIYPGETPIFERPDDVRLLFELCKKY
jgi:hypothetical protein